MLCKWCRSTEAIQSKNTVYWELPDGSRAITINETPCIHCEDCGMQYQTDETTEIIENHLLIIDTKLLPDTINYEQLLAQPKILKRNYFDFST